MIFYLKCVQNYTVEFSEAENDEWWNFNDQEFEEEPDPLVGTHVLVHGLEKAAKKWTMPFRQWGKVVEHLRVKFEARMPLD